MAKKYKVTKSFTYDGKRYYVYADTVKEAIMKMANKLRDLEEGHVAINENMLVKDWAIICIDTYKTSQKENTNKNYRYMMNHLILDQIGTMQLKTVLPLHCQKLLNQHSDKSNYTIKQAYQMLNFIFKKATENKMIVTNPVESIVKPAGKPSTTHRAITEDERKHIMDVSELDRRFLLFLLMLQCGCRPSEAREAKGSDIKKIEGHNMLHIRGTKTKNADRLVPIPDDLYEKIKNTAEDAYIAPNQNGNKFTSQGYLRLWHRLQRELNISMGCKVYRNKLIEPLPLADDFFPYCLRHTYCTDLQKKNVDIRTAQYLMGHSDITLTANIYTHADTSTIIEAAKKINPPLEGTTVGTTLERN